MDYISLTMISSELSGILNIPPTLRNRKVQVIVLPVEDTAPENHKAQKRPIGFAKGAEIPDSFFEPLSEEELQLWGL
jgi:hypothetical protein